MRADLLALGLLVACAPAGPPAPAAASLGDPRENGSLYHAYVLQGESWSGYAERWAYIYTVENEVSSPQAAYENLTHDERGIVMTAQGARLEMRYDDCVSGGQSYNLSARLVMNGREFDGCAIASNRSQAPFLRAWRDACVAASPETRRVTLMRMEGDGGVFVRLTDNRGGSGADCRVPLDGAPMISPRDETTRYAGEGDFVLILPPYEPQPTPCGVELPTESGQIEGWLEYPAEQCASR